MNTAIASRTARTVQAEARHPGQLEGWFQVGAAQGRPVHVDRRLVDTRRGSNIDVAEATRGAGMMPSRSTSPPFWPARRPGRRRQTSLDDASTESGVGVPERGPGRGRSGRMARRVVRDVARRRRRSFITAHRRGHAEEAGPGEGAPPHRQLPPRPVGRLDARENERGHRARPESQTVTRSRGGRLVANRDSSHGQRRAAEPPGRGAQSRSTQASRVCSPHRRVPRPAHVDRVADHGDRDQSVIPTAPGPGSSAHARSSPAPVRRHEHRRRPGCRRRSPGPSTSRRGR